MLWLRSMALGQFSLQRKTQIAHPSPQSLAFAITCGYATDSVLSLERTEWEVSQPKRCQGVAEILFQNEFTWAAAGRARITYDLWEESGGTI